MLVPEDENISLSERCKRANKLAAHFGKDNVILVSIHLNASQKNQEAPIGWEVHTYLGKSASDEYATIFWNKAKETLPVGTKMRGDQSDGDPDWDSNFAVLRDTVCPALLTENLFMTSHEDCKYLNSEEGFEAIVNLHIKAMQEITKLRNGK
ncbi:MAG: N-acetylmuramoyl-L-alanine amidase [Muribaculaceae bacterium]|nr:N-acetylmuramoyl-L-alanine amidase [Muribaculaceae bacterium]